MNVRRSQHREMTPPPRVQRPAMARSREVLPTPLSPETKSDWPRFKASETRAGTTPHPADGGTSHTSRKQRRSSDAGGRVRRPTSPTSGCTGAVASGALPPAALLAAHSAGTPASLPAQSGACTPAASASSSWRTRVAWAASVDRLSICPTRAIIAPTSCMHSIWAAAAVPNSISPTNIAGANTTYGNKPTKLPPPVSMPNDMDDNPSWQYRVPITCESRRPHRDRSEAAPPYKATASAFSRTCVSPKRRLASCSSTRLCSRTRGVPKITSIARL
mmetsp:Transcript_99600/g.259657  ORF Transcript_99600/g.259657 Transcript_99600/m.259657 type:complete len:275 (+) Transcript_99600:507-1331(+)